MEILLWCKPERRLKESNYVEHFSKVGGAKIVWETILEFCKPYRPTDAVHLSHQLLKVLRNAPSISHLGSNPRDGSKNRITYRKGRVWRKAK